ncbi:unnamed protein product [Somion occarium]|uniref:Rho-GAP domain-containing protein n=1 Tax=Somion occarium TaxID=3059160 RepID=A0ABP1EAH9_9APHY
MWKERLQQLGQRRNHNKRGSNHRDRNSRLRANTTPAVTSDDLASAREFTIVSRPAPPGRVSTMDSAGLHPIPPSKVNLKAWWNHFNFAQKAKKEAEEKKGQNVVFGKPLKESLRYASVQISTANSNGDLYVWGYVPVVVAKCGLYLKENATEVQGTFRISGSAKRMRDLQAEFEKPPRNLDWKKEHYTAHDVAISRCSSALAKKPYNQDEVIATYKRLIRSLPRANQYLLLYVLDLLHVFSRKADKNLMDAKNLAVIFRPALLSHPSHELSPREHQLSQDVLEFLIHHQDWFMLDIPPAPVAAQSSTGAPLSSGMAEAVDFMPSSDEDQPGGWKLIDKDTLGSRRISRRRTTTERSGDSAGKGREGPDLSPVMESPPSRSSSLRTATTISRSRTLPSSKTRLEGTAREEERHTKLLKKQKRASMQQQRALAALAPAG